MADLRIVDAPLLLTVKGTEKLPTGGEGNFSVSIDQVADFAKLKWFLATEEYVDNAVGSVQADLNLHKNSVSNPHGVTKVQVGLGNVDNTADVDKPIGSATQAALSTLTQTKADKTYVDTQLNNKADKATTYTKTETESLVSAKSDTTYVNAKYSSHIKTFLNTGTALSNTVNGEYFFVISNDSEKVEDLYLNTDGVATNQNKSELSSLLQHNSILGRDITGAHQATSINTASGVNQQDINDFGGAKWYNKSGGYVLGATVKLTNGYIVKSTEPNNTANPNVDMTGWVDATTDSKLNIQAKISTSSDFGDVEKAATKYLLSDKYSTLAAAQVDFPFADDLSASLGWAILQKQFNATGSSFFELSAITGKFYVNRPLNFVEETTKNVIWNLELLLDGGSADDWAITFNVNTATHVGRIDLNCYETDTFDNYDWGKRSWFNGIKCNRVIGGDFYGLSVLGRLKGRLFEVDGISHNANYFKIGSLSGACGSINNSFTRNIVSKTNTGNHSSSDQRTVININTAIGFNIAESVVKIGSDYHIVTANSGSSITVYPHVSDGSTSLSIFYGGILKTKGDNANSLIIKQIRSFESANAYALDTAYGVKVENFGAEFSGTGLQYGLNPDSIVGSLNIDLWYTEVNEADIVDVTCENKVTPIVITAQSGLVGGTWASKVVKLAPIDSANKKVEGRNVNLDLPFGFLVNSTELGVNKSTGYSVSGTVYHYFGTRKRVRVINDSAGITLAVDDKIKALGIFECEISHTGSKHNGGVDFTVIVCEAPYTIFEPDEVSQRVKYFPATAHPRKLIVRLHGTVFHVSDVSENSYKPYADLSRDFGTGIVNADAFITQNTGTGFGSTYNAVQSFKTNSDVFTALNVDVAYSVNAQNRAVIRTRGRRGSTVSDWTALLNTAKFADVATLSGSETSAQIAAKLNEIIDLLKSNT